MHLLHAFECYEVGVALIFRTPENVFSHKKFKTKSKNFECLIRDLQYIDHTDCVAQFGEDLHLILDHCSVACDVFGLGNRLRMTEVIITPPLAVPNKEPTIIM